MTHIIKIAALITAWFAILMYTTQKDNEQKIHDREKHCKRLYEEVGPAYRADKLCEGVEL